jgi:hypothetical protein
MTNDGIEQLLARAREAGKEDHSSMPSDFPGRVYSQHLFAVRRGRITFRASILSISAALVIFAALVGWNFQTLLMAGPEESDPVDAMAQSLWDSAGN